MSAWGRGVLNKMGRGELPAKLCVSKVMEKVKTQATRLSAGRTSLGACWGIPGTARKGSVTRAE